MESTGNRSSRLLLSLKRNSSAFLYLFALFFSLYLPFSITAVFCHSWAWLFENKWFFKHFLMFLFRKVNSKLWNFWKNLWKNQRYIFISNNWALRCVLSHALYLFFRIFSCHRINNLVRERERECVQNIQRA